MNKDLLKLLDELNKGERNYILGYLLQCEGNKEEAMKYYRFAADHGHPEAQCNLGSLLEEEAIKYYRFAADQGFVPAQSKLNGLMEEETIATVSESDYEEVIIDSELPF
jgi:TPR repeat protein